LGDHRMVEALVVCVCLDHYDRTFLPAVAGRMGETRFKNVAALEVHWRSISSKPSPASKSAASLESVKDLLIAELRDLHDAEEQLVEALPKMVEAASSTELKNTFTHHLGETKNHVTRLDGIFKRLSEKPSGETCEAMKGLVKEGEQFIHAKGEPDVRDAGLIGAAQRVEHYEMAGYGTVRTMAKRLGFHDIAEILQKTLDEEAAADEKLTAVAEGNVNPAATKMAAK
jgi:ferritin-like metal-binding protein YciE